ncbi:thioredoxin TrxC [Pelomonas sp. SE-A7]|uniref:thioredoxin TrxC n=1 Tax=Pelomonas sp. SE-A7 TaxID=3054953 RepID=UPI00259CA590|nr:thioredoxin TrxC [Pelomonas sp. SE-A7]MDM4767111.1 thioredoxin TrxC [Pelomonas sp. SE-A7]
MCPPIMLIACPHCYTKNRVPAERAAEDPTCGRCGKALLSGQVVELDETGFDAVVGSTEIPVLVDFWAPWCGPCRMMAPQFEEAARRLKGRALLVKVNSDEAPRLSQRFAIRSIPTLIRFEAGQEQQRISGALQAAQIIGWMQ